MNGPARIVVHERPARFEVFENRIVAGIHEIASIDDVESMINVRKSIDNLIPKLLVRQNLARRGCFRRLIPCSRLDTLHQDHHSRPRGFPFEGEFAATSSLADQLTHG